MRCRCRDRQSKPPHMAVIILCLVSVAAQFGFQRYYGFEYQQEEHDPVAASTALANASSADFVGEGPSNRTNNRNAPQGKPHAHNDTLLVENGTTQEEEAIVANVPVGTPMNATQINVTASLTDNATTPEEKLFTEIKSSLHNATGTPDPLASNLDLDEYPLHAVSNAENVTGIEIPMVVSLSGELGNHMFEMGAAHVMKWQVAESMNVNLRLSYRGQNYAKSHKTAKNYHMCFPAFRSTIFNEHNTDAFKALQLEQDSIYGDNAFVVDSAFDVAAVQKERFIQKLRAAINATKSTTHNSTLQKDTNLRIPFLVTKGVWQNLRLLSEHRDRLKDLFRMNETECCKEIPSPDETVVHVRGFVREMPRRGKSLGFQELEPDRMANELLGHLNSGDRVAIISRFASGVETHVAEMEKRGLQVRVISDQWGVQDFCFLTRAKRGVAGISKSTFFSLAAFLGDAERIDAYEMHTPHTKKNYRGELNMAEYMYPNTTDYSSYHLHHFPQADATA